MTIAAIMQGSPACLDLYGKSDLGQDSLQYDHRSLVPLDCLEFCCGTIIAPLEHTFKFQLPSAAKCCRALLFAKQPKFIESSLMIDDYRCTHVAEVRQILYYVGQKCVGRGSLTGTGTGTLPSSGTVL